MSTTAYPTRLRRAPRRFDPEDFVPGANNKHTVGRQIDAGHDVCSESEEHQWRREDRLREQEEAQWLEESDEELEIGTESEEEEEALSDSEEEESDSEEEESEWSDEDDDDEEGQQLEEAADVEAVPAPAPPPEATMEEELEDSVYFSANENASWEEWGRRLRREWSEMNDDPDEGVAWTDEEWGLWAKEQMEALWDDARGEVPSDEEWAEWGKKLCGRTDLTVCEDWTEEKWAKWGKDLCWNARMVTLNVEWATWAKCEWEKWGDGPAGNWSDAEWTEWGKSLFARTVV